jgi:seryl-tRNA synthetase
MLDAALLRTQPDLVREKIALKNADPALVDQFLELDAEWRKLTAEIDSLRNEQKKAGEARDMEAAKKLKEQLKEKEAAIAELEKQRAGVWQQIPNLPTDDTPPGKDESGNQVVRKWGDVPQFDFKPLDHVELGEKLGLLDIERAAKVSGARFAYIKNDLVLLEFALVRFAFETLTKAGFIPVVPPVLIRESITQGLGYWEAGGSEDHYLVYNPKDEGDAVSNLYLVGTAEHALVPMHQDEVLQASELPRRYAAFSTCFRREAGSYGRDMRGIFRVHQFDKVEMVSLVPAEQEIEEHERLLGIEEGLFQALQLPYQVVRMCTGDLGFPISRKYDLEVWLPGQGAYRELTSTSTTGEFQSRAFNIKYHDGKEKHFARILNGTAFAVGRTLIAIMENYQQADGSIAVPEVLRPYVGKDRITAPRA